MINSQASVHPSAKIGNNVTIGPWSIIGAEVEIEEGTYIGPHVVIQGQTHIGKNNTIHPFVTLGGAPQHLSDAGENAQLIIGDSNTIREYCSIHRGTTHGNNITQIGHNNYIMSYVHIGHDCTVGNHIVFTNNVSLAGHVTVDDYALLAGFAAAHQFCRIGAYAMLGAGCMISQDVLPYVLATNYPAAVFGLNRVGLRRRGFKESTVQALKRAYKLIFLEHLPLDEIIAQLKPLALETPEIERFIVAIQHSKRGILRKQGRNKSD